MRKIVIPLLVFSVRFMLLYLYTLLLKNLLPIGFHFRFWIIARTKTYTTTIIRTTTIQSLTMKLPQLSPTRITLCCSMLQLLFASTVVGATSSRCDCLPTEGYLVTRLWNIVGNLTDQDVIDEFKDGFAPIVTNMEGFQRYTAATTGDSSTVFFMNQFDTAEHASAAQEGAAKFVNNGVLNGNITPNQFTENDQLAYHFGSVDCVTSDSTGLFLGTRLYEQLVSGTTTEMMYEASERFYNETLKDIDGFVSYSGALSSHNVTHDKVFVYNIFETSEGATEANEAGTKAAATAKDVPKNELLASTSGYIQFDYLCADSDSTTKPSSSPNARGFSNIAAVVLLLLGVLFATW